MLENIPARLGIAAGREPEWYAQLSNAAWSCPTIDPFNDPDPNIFSGKVGRFTRTGWVPDFGESEICFMLGACSGAFYRTEVVRVIRWPFWRTIPGHDFKWIAVGLGTIAAWATFSGLGWEIMPGSSIGGGPVPVHTIKEYNGSGTLGTLDAFPGQFAPLARTEVTLTQAPAQFRWCAAQGLFYPLVQVPTDSGIPAAPSAFDSEPADFDGNTGDFDGGA
jgi:hypothetical protein